MKVKTLPALDGVRVLATVGIFMFYVVFLNGTFPVTLFYAARFRVVLLSKRQWLFFKVYNYEKLIFLSCSECK